MTLILRYLNTASANSQVPSRESHSQEASKPVCTECNYADNYYGDQVCVAGSR